MIYIKLTKSNKNNKLATIIIIHNYTIYAFSNSSLFFIWYFLLSHGYLSYTWWGEAPFFTIYFSSSESVNTCADLSVPVWPLCAQHTLRIILLGWFKIPPMSFCCLTSTEVRRLITSIRDRDEWEKGDRIAKPQNRHQPRRPRLLWTAARTTGC